ncbi:hypothetical protein D3C76_1807370 [compost metagenome]
MCPATVAATHGLIQVLPEHFGFEVDVWIAMHNDLRKVGRIARTFEALGEALNRYLAS